MVRKVVAKFKKKPDKEILRSVQGFLFRGNIGRWNTMSEHLQEVLSSKILKKVRDPKWVLGVARLCKCYSRSWGVLKVCYQCVGISALESLGEIAKSLRGKEFGREEGRNKSDS